MIIRHGGERILWILIHRLARFVTFAVGPVIVQRKDRESRSHSSKKSKLYSCRRGSLKKPNVNFSKAAERRWKARSKKPSHSYHYICVEFWLEKIETDGKMEMCTKALSENSTEVSQRKLNISLICHPCHEIFECELRNISREHPRKYLNLPSIQ